MPHDLPQVVPAYHDITVADENKRMMGFSIGGYEVIYFRIESDIALLHDKGYVPVRVFVLYFFCYFVGRIVEVLKAKENFVFRIILKAETGEVVEKIVVKSLEGFQDRDRRGIMNFFSSCSVVRFRLFSQK
jgi:hypothetical protein